MESKTPISIWFFVGLTLVVNGALILGAAFNEFVTPVPVASRVVLYELHAGLWWGALLLVCGVAYCYRFRPWKRG